MSKPLTLEKISFVAGSTPGDPGLEVSGSQVVILVGPNNSGKSTALRELEDWASGQDVETKVVEGADVSWPSAEEGLELIKQFEVDPRTPIPADNIYVSVHRPGAQNQVEFHTGVEDLRNRMSAGDFATVRHYLLQPFTLRLDGRGRFSLADPQPSGDLYTAATNHLVRLLQSKPARCEVRKLISDAFGYYFFVDMTGLTELRVRMSEVDPPDGFDELSVRQESLDFAKASPLLSELGDGVQAYTGLVSAIIGIPSRLILIDEPEAFLHPILSRRLGRDLTRLVGGREGTMVVSTHSADFLMGCIEESDSSAIVRLTYEGGLATARSLSASALSDLMRDPMLRSTGALSGLSHRAVVVTEGDSDRTVYGEINRRLGSDGRGIDDCLFLNAQNWQTIAKLIGPLRQLGIPAAAVVDFDVIRSDQKWPELFEAAGMNVEKRDDFNRARSNSRSILAQYESADTKTRGLEALTDEHTAVVAEFLDAVAEYGIFVVPVGELEGWLRDLEINASKQSWVPEFFERLGANPDSGLAAEPSQDDVWAFIDRIADWVSNPARLGIPAG